MALLVYCMGIHRVLFTNLCGGALSFRYFGRYFSGPRYRLRNQSILPKKDRLSYSGSYYVIVFLDQRGFIYALQVFFTCKPYPHRVLSVKNNLVCKGISAQASHRTIREPLNSYGSCYPSCFYSQFPMVEKSGIF